MKGFLEAVIEDSGMDEETRRRFLVRASDNTDRMVAIVTDLLTLARVEAADGALKRERIDLREICSEALAQAGGVAAVREISLQVDLPGEAVMIAGDRTALTTAVMNLLDNAIKYSPRGGRVRMRVGAAAGAEAVVDVEDNGPGIPSHETERIFERFYRVDKNRSRELGGTGLGLSIVRNVMLAHGGRVTVSSVLGEGSTFRLHIPVLAGPRAAVSSGAGPAA
jgi:signal transduction histidine kinase